MKSDLFVDIPIEFISGSTGGSDVPTSPIAQTGDVLFIGIIVSLLIAIIGVWCYRIVNNKIFATKSVHTKLSNIKQIPKTVLATCLVLASVISLIASLQFAFANNQNQNTLIVNPEKIQISVDNQTEQISSAYFSITNVSEYEIYFDSTKMSLTDEAKQITASSNWDISVSSLVSKEIFYKGAPDGSTYTVSASLLQQGASIDIEINFDKFNFEDAKRLIGKRVFDFGLYYTANIVEVPEAIPDLIYNGQNQTGVLDHAGYAITGNTARDAGNYEAVASLNEGCIWSDGTTSPKTISWSIAKANIDISIEGKNKTYTYDKNTTYVFPDYDRGEIAYTASCDKLFFDASKITPSATSVTKISAKDAGTYFLGLTSVDFKYLNDNVVVNNWNITDGYLQVDRASVDVPIAKTGLFYNGNVQYGVEDGEGYTLVGNSAINANDYTALANVDSNHIWSDKTTEEKQIPWSIQKAVIDISIEGKNKTYTYDKNTTYVFPDYDRGEIAYTASCDKSFFDASKITPSATSITKISAKDAGTYFLGLTSVDFKYLNDNVVVNNWNITDGYLQVDRASVDIPIAKTGLIYDGKCQIGVEVSEGFTLSGNSATNANNYTAFANVDSNHIWSDKTTEEKTIPWSIQKAIIDRIEIIGATRTETYQKGVEYELPEGDNPAYIAYGHMHEGHPQVFDPNRIVTDPKEISKITAKEAGHYPLMLNTYKWSYSDVNVEVSQSGWDITDGYLQINSQGLVDMSVVVDKESAALSETITYTVNISNISGSAILGAKLMFDNATVVESLDIPKDADFKKKIQYEVQAKDFSYPYLNKTITFVMDDEVPYYESVKTSVELTYKSVDVPVVSDIDYDGQYHDFPVNDAYYIYGDTTAKDANKYVSVLILNPGYIWKDGTRDIKIIYWEIKKIELILSFDTKGSGYYNAVYGQEWQVKSDMITYNVSDIPQAENPKSILGADPQASCYYIEGDSVGKYPVNIIIPEESLWKSHNYNVVLNNSYLAVTKKPIQLMWLNTNVTYNGQIQYAMPYTNQAYKYDEPHFEVAAFSDKSCTTKVDPKNAGKYYEKASLIEDATGKNYSISSGDTAVCTINRISSELFNFVTSEGQVLSSEIKISVGQTITGTFDYIGDGNLTLSPRTSDYCTYTFRKDDASKEAGSGTFEIKSTNAGSTNLDINLERSKNYNLITRKLLITSNLHADTAKALLVSAHSATPKSLRFVYDSNSYIVGQDNIEAIYQIDKNTVYDPVGSRSIYPAWYNDVGDVEVVDIDQSFIYFNSFSTNENNGSLTSLDLWFANMPNLKSVFGIKYIWSGIKTVNAIFKDSIASNLECFDLSQFNQLQISSAVSAFENCKFQQIDLPESLKADGINYKSCFKGCSNMSKFDEFESITFGQDTSSMFEGCSSLKKLDVSNWETSQVTDMSKMFKDCKNLLVIYCKSNADWRSSLRSIVSSDMFKGCVNIEGYSPDKVDINMAHADGLYGYTGYFLSPSGASYYYNEAAPGGPTIEFMTDIEAEARGLKGHKPVPKIWSSIMSPFEEYSNLTIKVTSTDNFALWMNNVTSTRNWFYNFQTLQNINVRNWDTSKVTNMSSMFYGCSALNQIDVSNWEISQVADMSHIFDGCQALEQLDVSNWKTSNIENVSHMFNGCQALEQLDVSNWDVSKISDFSNMFCDCFVIEHLEVSSWETNDVKDMSYMFCKCNALDQLDISNWNTSKVVDMSYMFKGCAEINELDITNWNTSLVTDMSSMFNGCEDLQRIRCNADTDWRRGEGEISSVDMFKDCISLYGYLEDHVGITMGHANGLGGEAGYFTPPTKGVYFYNNLELECPTIEFMTEWEAQKRGLENYISVPTKSSLDVSPFEELASTTKKIKSTNEFGLWMKNVESTRYWFDNFQLLENIDVSNWDTGHIADMKSMFNCCYDLNQIDVSNWKTDLALDMSCMFKGCKSLNKVEVFNWDTSKVTDMRCMFDDCETLIQLDVSKWDTGQVRDMSSMFNGCKDIEHLDVSSWETHQSLNMSYMFNDCKALCQLDVSKWLPCKATDMSYMFNDCKAIKQLNVSSWDTGQVTDMSYMFNGCEALEQLDASIWNTGGVKNMSYMFNDCLALNQLGVSKWDTSKAIDMSYMFNNCEKLIQLDVCSWNTGQVKSMCYLFNGCGVLEDFDISKWDTGQVIDMSNMLCNCHAINQLDVTNWDTNNVVDTSNMLNGCGNLQKIYCASNTDWRRAEGDIDSENMFLGCINLCGYIATEVDIDMAHAYGLDENIGYFTPPSAGTGVYYYNENNPFVPTLEFMTEWEALKRGLEGYVEVPIKPSSDKSPFGEYSASTKIISSTNDFGLWMKNVESIKNWFNGFQVLENIDVSNWDTSKVANMNSTFRGCKLLNMIDVSNWDTSKVTDMGYMFYGCKAINQLGVSNWDTSKVTNMSCMFDSCSLLSELDVSNWNTGQVTNMFRMFIFCKALNKLDVSNWDTSKVTNMSNTFKGCEKLSILDVANWDTGNVTDMSSMFSECHALWVFDVSNWNTEQVENTGYMFSNCQEIYQIDVTNWNTSKVMSMNEMFKGCQKLQNIYCKPDTDWRRAEGGIWSTNMFLGCVLLEGYLESNVDITMAHANDLGGEKGYFTPKPEGVYYYNEEDSDCPTIEFMTEWEAQSRGITDYKPVPTNWNSSKSPFEEIAGSTKKVTSTNDFGSWMNNVKSTRRWFDNFVVLENIDVSKWDTSQVTDMYRMFSLCRVLNQIDVSNWNTSKVANMYSMFLECNKIYKLDVYNWDTSQVTDIRNMFEGCFSLEHLDVSNWNTHKISNTSNVFRDCRTLIELNLSNWNTGQVTDMSLMFSGCYALALLDISNLDTSQVKDMSSMFENCRELKKLDVYNWDTSQVQDMSNLFDSCYCLSQLNVSNWKTNNVKYMNATFSGCKALNQIDVSSWDTSNVASMRSMLSNCEALNQIDISNWDTSYVKNTTEMFNGCKNLRIIYSKPDTDWRKAEGDIDSEDMFLGCINLDGYLEDNVDINMAHANGLGGDIGYFNPLPDGVYYYNETEPDCPSLEFMTGQEAQIRGIVSYKPVPTNSSSQTSPFEDFASTTKIINSTNDFGTWMKNVESTKSWFYGFYVLENINVSNWDTSKVVNMSGMFEGCEKLQKIYSSPDADWRRVEDSIDSANMFKGCVNLDGYSEDNVDVKMAHANGFGGEKGYFTPYLAVYYYNDDDQDWPTLEFMSKLEAQKRGLKGYKPVPKNWNSDKSPFEEYSNLTKKVTFTNDFVNWTKNIESTKCWFEDFRVLQIIDVSKWNTSQVTDMSCMFSNCEALSQLDVSSWNTSRVENMNGVYSGCHTLNHLDVSSWNTSKVIDMSNLFYDCNVLNYLDVSNWDTRNTADMSWMFFGCRTLKHLEISNWIINQVAAMSCMFKDCRNLHVIYATFNTDWSKHEGIVESFEMFKGCSAIKGYSEDKVDINMAHVNGLGGKIGYFEAPTGASYYYDEEDWDNPVLEFMTDSEAKERGLCGYRPVPKNWNFERSPFDEYLYDIKKVTSTESFGRWMKNVKSTSNWFCGFYFIEYLDVSNWDTSQVIDMSSMFYECSSLNYLDVSSWDTSKVTDISNLFYDCNVLNYLDVSNWDTSKVINMNSLFQCCRALEQIDVAKWDTSQVKDMHYMFSDCNSLIKLDISKWDTSQAVDMYRMFNECWALTQIDIFETTNWEEGKDRSIVQMFRECTNLANIYCKPGADWRKAKGNISSENMFEDCSKLPEFHSDEIDIFRAHEYSLNDRGYFISPSNGVYVYRQDDPNNHYIQFMSEREAKNRGLDYKYVPTNWDDNTSPFKEFANNTTKTTTTLEFGHWMRNVESTRCWFSGFSDLKNIDVSNWETSQVTDMSYMFNECVELEQIDVSVFDTSKVTNMNRMFYECHALDKLDVSKWDTGKVTIMYGMFYNCTALDQLDISNWDTSQVSSMDSMFNGCLALNKIDVSKWDTSKAVYMSDMFSDCKALRMLDVSKWDTSKAVYMTDMFSGCKALRKLDVSNWDTSHVINMSFMFSDCENLLNIYSKPDTDWRRAKGDIQSTNMFLGCVNLGGYYHNFVDVAMAHADALGGDKGYFTPKSDGVYYFNQDDPNCPIMEFMTEIEAQQSGIVEYRIVPTNWDSYPSPFYEFAGTTKKVTSTKDFCSWMSNVKSTKCWFYWFNNLENIDVSNWDTSNVINMSGMFDSCWNMKHLDISKWDTSQVTDMSEMFCFCENLQNIYCSSDTDWRRPDGGIGSYYMFYNCISLDGYTSASIDINMAHANGLGGEKGYFTPSTGEGVCYYNNDNEDCPTLEFMTKREAQNRGLVGYKLVPTNWQGSGSETSPFYQYKNSTKKIVSTAEFDCWMKHVESTSFWFSEFNVLQNIDISNWDTSQIKKMDCMFYNCRELSHLDIANWDTGQVTDMSEMFSFCLALNKIDVSKWDTSKVLNMYSMFYSCQMLNELNVSSWKTGWVNDMNNLFAGCAELKYIDVSKWDTSQVTNMCNIFGGCSTLNHLDISKWDTGLVTDMSSIFSYCNSLSQIDISNWNTSNVTNMSYMFHVCNGISQLDISKWNVSKVTDMRYMFNNCENLEKIYSKSSTDWRNPVRTLLSTDMFRGCVRLDGYLESNVDISMAHANDLGGEKGYFTPKSDVGVYYYNEDDPDCPTLEFMTGSEAKERGLIGYKSVDIDWTSNISPFNDYSDSTKLITFTNDFGLGMKVVKSTHYWFADFSVLQNIDVSNLDTSNVTNMSGMFYGCYELKQLDASDWDTGQVTDMGWMFYGCEALNHLDVSGWHTQKVTNMSCMFRECESLNQLNISYWNTSNVTNMSCMFKGCEALNQLYVTYWDTSKVADMSNMFYDCLTLSQLDASHWITVSAVDMSGMFYGCEELNLLPVSNWNTSKVTSMANMFYGCYELKQLDVTNWNTSRVTSMANMFYRCYELNQLDVSNWNTSKVTDMNYMFDGCHNLQQLTISNWNTAKVKSMNYMFNDCHNLKKIYCISDTDWRRAEGDIESTNMFLGCVNLNDYNPLEVDISMAHAYGLGGKSGYFTVNKGVYSFSEVNQELRFIMDDEASALGITSALEVPVKWTKNESPFAQYATTTRIISSTDAFAAWMTNVTSTSYWFSQFDNAEYFDLSKWDVSNVSDMSNMFINCSNIISLNVNNWKTTSVQDMSYMFCGCASMVTLNVSKFNVSNMLYMEGMFKGCSVLTISSLQTTNWSTEALSLIDRGIDMFEGCTNLPNYGQASPKDITWAKANNNEEGYFTVRS